ELRRPPRRRVCPRARDRPGGRQHPRHQDRQDRRGRSGSATGGTVRAPAGVVFVLALPLVPAPAAAQTVSDVLSFLLTNRAVQTDDFQRDAAAAAATRDTVTTLLGAELATLPPSLSSAGFTYRFNSMLGTAQRASSSFGSFFPERSLTAGKGQSALGVNVRSASYTRLDGQDLRDGRFVTT